MAFYLRFFGRAVSGTLHLGRGIWDAVRVFPMETLHFPLRGDHIRLCDLLKLAGIAESGGQGKQLVAAGEVTVDGQPESRKAAKIHAGQVVECRGARIVVKPAA
jgi:ribosome-associated protein